MLGLGLARGSASREAPGERGKTRKLAPEAKSKKDTDSVDRCLLITMAKLSLSTKLDTRALRAVAMVTYILPLLSAAASAIKEATQAFATQHKAASTKERQEMGSPPLVAWNGLISFAATEQPSKAQEFQAYSDRIRAAPNTRELLYEEVKHLRLTKAFSKPSKDIKKLEASVVYGSASAQLFKDHVHPWLLSANDAEKKEGMAPMGDLERKLQVWLDDQSDEEDA